MSKKQTNLYSDAALVAKYGGCLATSARRLDRVIASVYDHELRPLEVKGTQVSLLIYVASRRVVLSKVVCQYSNEQY